MQTVSTAFAASSASAAASSSSSMDDVASVSFAPPPIPPKIRSALAADSKTFRRNPRWYSTQQTLWNIGQTCQVSAQLDAEDAKSAYILCTRLSGLESGKTRVGPAGADIKVLYWQRQECCCSASSSATKLLQKNVCENGKNCKPFVAIIQVCWSMATSRVKVAYLYLS